MIKACFALLLALGIVLMGVGQLQQAGQVGLGSHVTGIIGTNPDGQKALGDLNTRLALQDAFRQDTTPSFVTLVGFMVFMLAGVGLAVACHRAGRNVLRSAGRY